MSNITIFLGLKFINSTNGNASFHRLYTSSQDSPFCDGPKDDELARELMGKTPTGVPFKTFNLTSNKIISQDKNSSEVPLNGTILTLTNPCEMKCNFADIANANVSYLNLGLYSDMDTISGTDGMAMKIHDKNGSIKIVTASLVRECVQSNVKGDFLTGYIAPNKHFIPKLIPLQLRIAMNLNVSDILNAKQIDVLFFTNPTLTVKSSKSDLSCCNINNNIERFSVSCNYVQLFISVSILLILLIFICMNINDNLKITKSI